MSDTPTSQDIREVLERIQGWPGIARSPQLANFLGYIVERRLDGSSQAIKAYAIAVDVFGRPTDFDPQSDPIVRVQARRLRAALADYFAGDGRSEHWRIDLPLGGYVPEFVRNPNGATSPPTATSPATAERNGLRPSPLALVLGVLLGVGLVAMVLVMTSRPTDEPGQQGNPATGLSRPSVTIFEFQDLTGESVQRQALAQLALELVTDLDLFGDLTVTFGIENGAPAAGEASQFVLTGIARGDLDAVQYSAILTDRRTQTVVWSRVFEAGVGADRKPAIDDVSREMAMALGSPRGPLHAEARSLIETGAFTDAASTYLCVKGFQSYRDSRDPVLVTQIETCLGQLSETDRLDPDLLALRAILSLDRAMLDDAAVSERLPAAESTMARALERDPLSSFVWEQRGRLYGRQGLIELARAAFGAAFQLNPANTDAIAAHAMLLAMRGQWREAEALITPVLAATPQPPPDWYFGSAAIAAYRSADFGVGLAYSEIYANADRPMGLVLAMLSGFNGGNGDAVNRYLPQILELEAFQQRGILPTLSRRVSDPVLLGDIRKGLIEAGVPNVMIEGL